MGSSGHVDTWLSVRGVNVGKEGCGLLRELATDICNFLCENQGKNCQL